MTLDTSQDLTEKNSETQKRKKKKIVVFFFSESKVYNDNLLEFTVSL